MTGVPITRDDNQIEKASRRLKRNGFSFLLGICVIPQEGQEDQDDPCETGRDYAFLEFHYLKRLAYGANDRMADHYSREDGKAQASRGAGSLGFDRCGVSLGISMMRGVTMLTISQHMKDVLAVTERVAILKNGVKIVECLTPGVTSEQLATVVMTGNLGDRNLVQSSATL